MKDIVYKCIECDHEFITNKGEGLKCPKCSGMIEPLRDATAKDKQDIERYKKPSTKQVNGKEIIVLRKQSGVIDSELDKLEEKYSEKFGCKVVVLEAGLEFIEKIDG